MANWSDIGEDMVDQFFGKLSCVEDSIRFGAVCKIWRSVVLEKKQRQGWSDPLSPWLMLAKEDEDTRSFFSPNQEKTISCSLPQAQSSRCWGSPCGWLVTVGLDLNINLVHPLSQIQLSLPPQPNLQSQSKIAPDIYSNRKEPVTPTIIFRAFLWKFCLLSTSAPLVTAVFGSANKLAFARPGDESWTCVESSIGSRDVILCKGKYYGVHHSGILRLLQLDEDIPKAIDIAHRPEGALSTDRFYVVDILEQLHMVVRMYNFIERTDTVADHYETVGFGVFKFDFNTMEWDELEELGDHALFVGNNTSFAISTITHPYFKRNCVYFTDDDPMFYFSNYNDMGVFNYEEDTIEPIFSEDVFSDIYRPLFFMPTL